MKNVIFQNKLESCTLGIDAYIINKILKYRQKKYLKYFYVFQSQQRYGNNAS